MIKDMQPLSVTFVTKGSIIPALPPLAKRKPSILVVPEEKPGSWYVICATMAISGQLSSLIEASPRRPVEGYTTCRIQVGTTHDQTSLTVRLREAGFNPSFVNNPPWASTFIVDS